MDGGEHALWLSVAERPADPLPLALLADYLGERADLREESLRWALRRGHRPALYQGDMPPESPKWSWGLPVLNEVTHTTSTLAHWALGPIAEFLSLGVQDDFFWGESRRRRRVRWYDSGATAWQDWCQAWAKCRQYGIDAGQAYSAVAGIKRTGSPWADASRAAIALRICYAPEWPALTQKKQWEWLRDAYPFGARQHHPYRIWCACCRQTVYSHAEGPAQVPRVTVEAGEVLCGWCRGRGCVACAEIRWEHARRADRGSPAPA